jgi:hypothetical protein
MRGFVLMNATHKLTKTGLKKTIWFVISLRCYEMIKLIFLNGTPLRKYSIFQRFVEITRSFRIRLLGW